MKTLQKAEIKTYTPEKWIIIDTETDEVYNFDLKYASDEMLEKALKSLEKQIQLRKEEDVVNTETKNVFIVKPSKHGNGGWCGSTLIKETTIEEALKEKPSFFGSDFEGYFEENDSYCYEFACELRICSENNPNKCLFIENPSTDEWEKY